MDTEFPGVVAKPVGTFKSKQDMYYAGLQVNVNLLTIIQLGITLFNERGEGPDPVCTWQFNFKFSIANDMYSGDSIDMLRTAGVEFQRLETEGIDPIDFAELLMTSGFVLCPEVRWLTFHGGYDFAYLLKLLLGQGQRLPEKLTDFAQLFHLYFPFVYDVKNLLRHTQTLAPSLGLDTLSDMLGIRRFGTAHQAGSDSLLTGHCYFRIVREHFDGRPPLFSAGLPFGLYDETVPGSGTPAALIATQSGTVMSTSGAFPSTPMSLVMHQDGGAGSASTTFPRG
jgi:CCR4-NOT transcription complex subunit 7/8